MVGMRMLEWASTAGGGVLSTIALRDAAMRHGNVRLAVDATTFEP